MKKYTILLMTLAGFLGLTLVGTNSYAQEKKKRKVKRESIRAERVTPEIREEISFVDAHVHLNDIDLQMRLMADHGISAAVIFWGRNSTNESLVEASRNYPSKLIPFVSVSPEREKYRRLWKNSDPKLLETLENHLKTGIFKGIGEISVTHFPAAGFPEADFSPISPMMKGILKLAEKYSVPINIHCEITRIGEFSELLTEFSNVEVIWAHGGYTPYFLAKRMLEEHPNLFYELSARTWLDHPRSPDYTIFKSNTEIWNQWLELVETNPNRFIVGTDASNHSMSSDTRKVKSVQLFLSQLSQETRKQVAEGNILRLTQDE